MPQTHSQLRNSTLNVTIIINITIQTTLVIDGRYRFSQMTTNKETVSNERDNCIAKNTKYSGL